jgi:hypothetical protein
MQVPTTDQLRDQIDRGVTGEKVSMPDPAAAPLGTDAEAAGMPPTAEERTQAAQEAPVLPHHDGQPAVSGRALYIGLILAVAVVLTGIVLLASS